MVIPAAQHSSAYDVALMPTVYVHDLRTNVVSRGLLLALSDGVRKIRKRAAQTAAGVMAACAQRTTGLVAQKGG